MIGQLVPYVEAFVNDVWKSRLESVCTSDVTHIPGPMALRLAILVPSDPETFLYVDSFDGEADGWTDFGDKRGKR